MEEKAAIRIKESLRAIKILEKIGRKLGLTKKKEPERDILSLSKREIDFGGGLLAVSQRWEEHQPKAQDELIITNNGKKSYIFKIDDRTEPLEARYELLILPKLGRIQPGQSMTIQLVAKAFCTTEIVKEMRISLENKKGKLAEESIKLILRSEESTHLDFSQISFLKQIGQGGNARVFLANYRGKQVAVKRMKEKSDSSVGPMTSFLAKEASLMLRASQHARDNIVQVIGTTFNVRNQPGVMVMELANCNLFTFLTSKELSVRDRLSICGMAVENVASLHSLGISHRDIKASNFLVFERDNDVLLKLADFGSATTNRKHNPLESSPGTWTHQAPEGFQKNEAGELPRYSLRRADIYSVGVLIYEIFIQKQVFSGLTPSEIIVLVCEGKRPQIPESIPSSVVRIVEKCWDAVPKKRPSIFQVLEELEALKDTLSNE